MGGWGCGGAAVDIGLLAVWFKDKLSLLKGNNTSTKHYLLRYFRGLC